MSVSSSPTMLIATRNYARVQLHRRALEDAGFRVASLLDMPAEADTRPSEDEPTAVANATMKARHFHSDEHPWTFAVDAGLRIDALGGEPGLMTRRWGGKFPDTISDEDWLAYAMDRLHGVPMEERTACMYAGWVLVDPAGEAHTHEAAFHFRITEAPIRPGVKGAPLIAVLDVGQEDAFAAREAHVYETWQQWSILPQLRQQFARA